MATSRFPGFASRSLLRLSVIVLSALGSTAAFAGTTSPDLARVPQDTVVRVIVQYANRSPRPAMSGSRVADLPMVNGELRSMTAGAARLAAQSAGVAHVTIDHAIQGTDVPVYDFTPQTIQPQTFAQSPSSVNAANMNRGKGIGVAVIDSGIRINADLTGNGKANGGSLGLLNWFPSVVYAQSFVPGEGVDDLYGHGTHVAGIIAGDGSNSYGSGYLEDIHGVAPGVNLISLKVLDKNGVSTDSEVIQAIDTAIALRNIFNIKVIN